MDPRELGHKWVKHFDQRRAIWENCLDPCTGHFEEPLVFVGASEEKNYTLYMHGLPSVLPSSGAGGWERE